MWGWCECVGVWGCEVVAGGGGDVVVHVLPAPGNHHYVHAVTKEDAE